MVKELEKKTSECLSEEILSRYLERKLTDEQKDAVEAHIADCTYCLDQLEMAQRAQKESKNVQIRPELIKKAKAISGERKMTRKSNWFKKSIWLILCLISFALSFFVSKFFVQFLVLAIIFGVKWIFDTGSTKTLIMIYDAWRGKRSEDTTRIADWLKKNRK